MPAEYGDVNDNLALFERAVFAWTQGDRASAVRLAVELRDFLKLDRDFQSRLWLLPRVESFLVAAEHEGVSDDGSRRHAHAK
jgi:hypothetical protein